MLLEDCAGTIQYWEGDILSCILILILYVAFTHLKNDKFINKTYI